MGCIYSSLDGKAMPVPSATDVLRVVLDESAGPSSPSRPSDFSPGGLIPTTLAQGGGAWVGRGRPGPPPSPLPPLPSPDAVYHARCSAFQEV